MSTKGSLNIHHGETPLFNSIRSLILRPRLKRLTRLVCVSVPPTRYSRLAVVPDRVKREPIQKREPTEFSASAQVLSNTRMTIWVNGFKLDSGTYPFQCRRDTPWSPWYIEGNPPCVGRGDEFQIVKARPIADRLLTSLTGTSERAAA